ncbi:MAG: DUF4386 family protein [Dehalococcoidia bacterium]
MTAARQREDTFGAALARWWLRLYTAGLPPRLRERRELELESDLHEHQADRLTGDASETVVGLEIVGRVVRGVPADLAWRMQLEAPPMELKIPAERVTGALILALLVLIPVSGAISGYDTARQGWESELSRLGGLSSAATSGNVLIQVVVGISLVGAGAGMFLALRPRAAVLGTLVAFGLAAAGVLTLASSAMYGVVAALADEHVAGRGSAEVTTASWAFARAMDAFVTSSMALLVLSVYMLAYALMRHRLAPQWIAWMTLLSAVPFVAGRVASSFGSADDAAWVVSAVGFTLVWLSVLLAGGSMLLSRSGPHAPAGGASSTTAP